MLHVRWYVLRSLVGEKNVSAKKCYLEEDQNALPKLSQAQQILAIQMIRELWTQHQAIQVVVGSILPQPMSWQLKKYHEQNARVP